MRSRWTLALPITGLLVFALLTYGSVRFNREQHRFTGKYFWWSSIRLDSQPGQSNPSGESTCKTDSTGEPCWEPASIWIDPGWLAKTLIISSLPAFLIGRAVVHALSMFSMSEVTTFMISMPPLIFGWFYLVSCSALSVWQRIGAKSARSTLQTASTIDKHDRV